MAVNRCASDSFLGGTGGFRSLKDITFRHDVRVLVGPVIGAVSSDSAVVLVEVDTSATIGLCVVLAGGFTGASIALLPEMPTSLGAGPSRAGQLHERLVRVQKLTLKACRPRSALVTGLRPGAQYQSSCPVSPDDSATRVGSFRTLRTVHNSQKMGLVDTTSNSEKSERAEGRVLLQHRHFYNRYRMQHEDKASFGGVATGPLENGLTAIAMSGDAKTPVTPLMGSTAVQANRADGTDNDDAIDEAKSCAEAPSDQSTSPGVNETSVEDSVGQVCDLLVLICCST